MRLDPVAEPAERCEVPGVGLPRWTERIVRFEVVEIYGSVGLASAVREQLDRMSQLHPFADPIGDLVGVHTDLLVEVDDRLDDVRSVADQLAQLGGEQGTETLGAEYAGVGGKGDVGQMHVHLSLTRPRRPARPTGVGSEPNLGEPPV